MSKFSSSALILLLASLAVAQMGPVLKPPPQSEQQQGTLGRDISEALLVDQCAGPAPGGPLVIAPTFGPGVTTAAQVAVIQQAIDEWQAIIEDSGTTTNPFPITFNFTSFAPGSNTLAVTNPSVNRNNGNLCSATMTFNSNQPFWVSANPPPTNCPPTCMYDLLSVTRHELGHALGWDEDAVRLKNVLLKNTAPIVSGNGAVRNANVVTITTTSPHGFSAGLGVTINGVVNTPVAIIAAGNGAVRNANVVTITTTSPHGLSPGIAVIISGVADPSFNGNFSIATVPSPTSFTYSEAAPNTTSGGGSVSTTGFDGDFRVATVPSPTTLTYSQTAPNATSGGGSASAGVVGASRLNTPVVFGSGLHADPTWVLKCTCTVQGCTCPTQGVVPVMMCCFAFGERRSISLYPDASLNAMESAYNIPMQFVDPSVVAGNGTATQPWPSLVTACANPPPQAHTPLLLANTNQHHVGTSFQCSRSYDLNGARGGATVSP